MCVLFFNFRFTFTFCYECFALLHFVMRCFSLLRFVMRRFLLLICLLAGVYASAREWLPDSLSGYEFTRVARADGGRCTVIRRSSPCGGNRGVLYIHGYNDYFFQAEEGDTFVDSCYSFYAVDLHGYGRSIRPGERPYQAKRVSDYYADLDSAINIMRSNGVDDVVLMGHSTGGLIAACYMSFAPSEYVDALILNSPFLEFNMRGFKRKVLLPAVACLGGLFPGLSIPQGDSSPYAESTSADFHGRWHYNFAWKTAKPRPVTAQWLRMILDAQSALRRHPEQIKVPILLMYSGRSVYGDTWTPEFQSGDAVLNVEDIKRLGSTLGPDITMLAVNGGLHDLFLSSPQMCRELYKAVFQWLNAL